MNREQMKDYVLMTLGALLLAIGNYVFKFPNHFSFGGVTGIATILSGVLPLSSSSLTTIFNMFFLLLGFIFLGRSFGVRTVYVTVIFSVMLELGDMIFPMEGPLTQQPVLELIFAIIIPSVGNAILFNRGASSGGTDILAMLLKKYLSLDIGKALIMVDALVVVCAFALFGPTTGLFSMAGLFAKSFVMDNAISDMNLNKLFTVICDESDSILSFIRSDLNRSATVYKAEGAYSHRDKTVILTVMSPMQAKKFRNYIHLNHPTAFMMITNSSEIDGKGFRAFF